MNRRNFLAALGLASTAIAIPAFALRQDRIITKGDPNAPRIRIVKNGKQVGLCYWVNLDTREYRRVALWVDFADKPYDGGRIVRHPCQADRTTIAYHFDADLELPVGHWDYIPKDWSYPIGHYPVVDYEGATTNIRSQCLTSLSVEGIADEIQISTLAPAHVLAQYPDLPRWEPQSREQ